MSTLHRVIVRTTSSGQPGSTWWDRKIIHIGDDVDAARESYFQKLDTAELDDDDAGETVDC